MGRKLRALICAVSMAGILPSVQEIEHRPTAPTATPPVPEAQLVPNWFGQLVEQHVRSMQDRGQYHAITNGVKDRTGPLTDLDFFHGHVLTRSTMQYPSLDAFLQSTQLVLYHTQELTHAWEREGETAPIHRTQRSIIGYRDARTVPAVEVIGLKHLGDEETYRQRGTITGADLLKTFTDLNDGGEWRTHPQIVSRTGTCIPDYQFLLRPDAYGRYTSRTQRFEVWIECRDPHKAPSEPPSVLLAQ